MDVPKRTDSNPKVSCAVKSFTKTGGVELCACVDIFRRVIRNFPNKIIPPIILDTPTSTFNCKTRIPVKRQDIIPKEANRSPDKIMSQMRGKAPGGGIYLLSFELLYALKYSLFFSY